VSQMLSDSRESVEPTWNTVANWFSGGTTSAIDNGSEFGGE
jgi:hypothetical protein